jgi:hypothetical protein
MVQEARMTKIFFAVLLLFQASFCSADELQPKQQPVVRSLIKAFMDGDRAAIAKRIRFPLHRHYPVLPINGQKEFLRRFDEVFDDDFRKAIRDSSPKDDWESMGWRGIMLYRGALWIDEAGLIIAVNHESKKEQEIREGLIEKERTSLHPSLQKFQDLVLVAETAKLRVRIDETGQDRYRYAVWPRRRSMAEKPDLILEDGQVVYEGSGGNHGYHFKRGHYAYTVYVWVIGADGQAPGSLEVSKDDHEILHEDFREMKP